jgi:3-deoxy-D-manno-octulosonic-acid transferase
MIAAPDTPLSLQAYRLATGLTQPFARPLLEARARRGKEDPSRLGERLGVPSRPRPEGPVVWLHAVSVGESMSLLPLIQALAAERGDLHLLVTSGTRASALLLGERLPERAIHQFAPVDTPRAVARFLEHWRPDAGLFAESELWPNLILGARARGVRLALVSARMTARSARAWRGQASAAKAVLNCFDLILPQDMATAERLAALGGRVSERLNLKRLGAPLACDAAELARLRGEIGERPVVVAVSTHASEEALVAGAVAPLLPRPLTILVPRHPERGDEIASELAGYAFARRALQEPIRPETEIYLADTLGEVGLFLRLAPIAIVGGGFAPDIGGHNPLEPARLGVGVITGPSVANHADVFAEMVEAGAALTAHDEAGLTALLARLMDDDEQRARLGAAALAYAAAQHGRLATALAQIRPLLPPP